MSSVEESTQPPEWLILLENKQKKPHCLAHELDAGSPCLKCGDKCPGLDLHFWRKVCKNCKCEREDHEIKEQDTNSHFLLFFKTGKVKPTKAILELKLKGSKENKVPLDWIPPDVPHDMACDYIKRLPYEKSPISNTKGAVYRRQQIEKQIPLYDFNPNLCHELTEPETNELEAYATNVRHNIVGQGRLVRIPVVKGFKSYSSSVNTSQPYTVKPFGSQNSLKSDSRGPSPSRVMNTEYKNESQQAPNQKAIFYEQRKVEPNYGRVGFERGDVRYSDQLSLNQPQYSQELRKNPSPQPQDGIFSEIHAPPSYIMYSKDLNNGPFDINDKPNPYYLPGSQIPGNTAINRPDNDMNYPSDRHFTSNDNRNYIPTHHEVAQNYKNAGGLTEPSMNENIPTKAQPFDVQQPNFPGPTNETEHSGVGLPPPILCICPPAPPNYPGPEKLQNDFESMTLNEKYICEQCNNDIEVGTVAIVVEKKGKVKVWHPECFVCTTCNELLVDLLYFYYKGKVYCGRDYAQATNVPRCYACDELIFTKTYTCAEGQNFHIRHFCCLECDVSLTGEKYLPKNGHPICLPCYHEKYAKRCHTCKDVITASEKAVCWKELSWHAVDDCFACFQCKKTLLNSRFVMKNNQPFCSSTCVHAFQGI